MNAGAELPELGHAGTGTEGGTAHKATHEVSMPPLTELVKMLREFEGRLEALPDEIDPSWLDRIFAEDEHAAWQREVQAMRRAALLRRSLKLQSVPPEAFAGKANRMALLERETLWKVLAARALFARRGALRKCIERAVIEPLRGVVGGAALDILRTANAESGADRREPHLPRACPSSAAWAWSGYASFERAGVWGDASLRTMIRVSLPAAAPHDMPPAEDAAPTDDSEFVQILPKLYPELTWLFG